MGRVRHQRSRNAHALREFVMIVRQRSRRAVVHNLRCFGTLAALVCCDLSVGGEWGREVTNQMLMLTAKAIPPRYRPFAKKIYRRVSSFGLNFKCPFCKASLRQFLPYGGNFPVLKQL